MARQIHEENENNQSEEDEFDLGGGGESGEHHLYYFYISELIDFSPTLTISIHCSSAIS